MKNMVTEATIITSLLTFLTAGAFGSFGGMIQYLYLVVKGTHKYDTMGLLTYMVLGLFVGMVADQFMTEVFGTSFPGVVLVSGFLVIKVLDFLNASGMDILLRWARLNDKKNDNN